MSDCRDYTFPSFPPSLPPPLPPSPPLSLPTFFPSSQTTHARWYSGRSLSRRVGLVRETESWGGRERERKGGREGGGVQVYFKEVGKTKK